MASAYSSRVFSIVNAVFKKNIGLDPINMSRMMAEQLTHDLGGRWGFDTSGKIVYQDDAETFSVDWNKGGAMRFPLIKGEMENGFNSVTAMDHFAPDPEPASDPDPEIGEGRDELRRLIVSIETRQARMDNTLKALLGTVDTLIDILGNVRNELAEIKDNQTQSYTAQLNFKQVTFHPVKRTKK
jgi:hypothetical protein